MSLAAAIGRELSFAFDHVTQWRERVELLCASAVPPVTELDDAVEWIVAPALAGEQALLGAGFVAAPGLLRDAPWHFAWWLSPANGVGLAGRPRSLRRLAVAEDPAADGFHDYTRLEWWREAAAGDGSHLTGPYIDFLCTDELTLTITAPVRVGERMLGVVGADLSVTAVERVVDTIWGAERERLLLVGESGRVVATNDPRVETGSLIEADGAGLPVAGCGGTLALVVHRTRPEHPEHREHPERKAHP